MVLVTATAPYMFILVFLIRAVTLDGAGKGLEFLFYPQWEQLADVQVRLALPFMGWVGLAYVICKYICHYLALVR